LSAIVFRRRVPTVQGIFAGVQSRFSVFEGLSSTNRGRYHRAGCLHTRLCVLVNRTAFFQVWTPWWVTCGFQGSFFRIQLCTFEPLSHGSRIGRYRSNPVIGRPPFGSDGRAEGNPGNWAVFRQPTSRLASVNHLARDGRTLRHQRGSKVAVENRNSIRKLREEGVRRGWKKPPEGRLKRCMRRGWRSEFLSASIPAR